MKRSFLISLSLLLQGAALAHADTVAEITRSPSFDLLATEVRSAQIVDLSLMGKNDYQVPENAIKTASIELNLLIEPNGCNTEYVKGEIIADVAYDVWGKEQNPEMKIRFGTLDRMGVFYHCVGVPPRPARIKVSLVNGIGRHFKVDRTITVQFDGPRNPRTNNPEQWLVPVRLNQSAGTIEVGEITRKSDEPQVPESFIQKFECDFSGRFHEVGQIPAEHRLEVTLKKAPGALEDSKNYKASVTGQAEEFFGAGSGPQKFSLVGDSTPVQYGEFKLSTSPGVKPELQMAFQPHVLGWKGPTMATSLQQGKNVRLGSCTTLNVKTVR